MGILKMNIEKSDLFKRGTKRSDKDIRGLIASDKILISLDSKMKSYNEKLRILNANNK